MHIQGKITVITGAGSGIGRAAALRLACAYESATAKPPEDMPLLKPEDIADGFVQLITDDALAGRTLLIGAGLRDFAPQPPLPIN